MCRTFLPGIVNIDDNRKSLTDVDQKPIEPELSMADCRRLTSSVFEPCSSKG